MNDERPSFSIRALPAPAKVEREAAKHMCLTSMDYPYVMQQLVKIDGVQSGVLPNYAKYLKGGETIDGKPISIF